MGRFYFLGDEVGLYRQFDFMLNERMKMRMKTKLMEGNENNRTVPFIFPKDVIRERRDVKCLRSIAKTKSAKGG